MSIDINKIAQAKITEMEKNGDCLLYTSDAADEL